ncbi:MAG: hypothetical protein Q8N03_17400 [Ignavibacteria bacterium]|jgi:hypothetical protein|nr:hypothetical protein [Ignavibacteria bacterium]MDP3829924.1 hypothetical protein [Ignavibacteriaceae bacterium]
MEKEKSKSAKRKNSYVSKVENKYIFNVSLIFWHLFITLSALAVVVCLAIFLWSVIPASQREVEKKPYPAKKQYPEPVKVSLNDLQLDVKKEEAPPVAPEPTKTKIAATQQPVEDTKGKGDYDASLNTLKTLIPPSKYSWQGSGYWSYPYGERYWTFYKLEKYRQWNSTEAGIEDKLKSAYKISNADKYPEKKLILDGYISVVKLLSEEKRLGAIQDLISNVADNTSQNVNISTSLTKVIPKIPMQGNISYLNQLAYFGKINPSDGSLFIDYIATILDNFDASKRAEIIECLITGYNNYFGHNLSMLKEATDLFLPLVAQIKVENQTKAIMQYYVVFRNKNYARDNSIAEIENEYQQAISEIELQYNLDQIAAQQEYYSDEVSKTEYRLKSLTGIGGGILLIVLIAVVLVFFSIQRSVRKIEEKMSANGEIENRIV